MCPRPPSLGAAVGVLVVKVASVSLEKAMPRAETNEAADGGGNGRDGRERGL